MAELSRYSVSRGQAGLDGGVFKNKPSIKDPRALEDAETVLLADTYSHFSDLLQRGELRLGLPLLFKIHHFFLNPLYVWAGKIRVVDISKDGMMFCPAINIRASLDRLKREWKTILPSKNDSRKGLSHKLAIIHNELNAIHPFREGNGRTIRLFIDLLAMALGYQPIDYGKSERKKYFEACRAGMSLEHEKMERLFFLGLKK